jgi:hypothetical protein
MDSFKHDVPTLGGGQANFKQCWLASYGMLFRFHKLSSNSIEDKLRGAGIDVADAKNAGLLDTQFKKAGEALGLKCWSGTVYKAEQGFWDVGLSDGCEAFLELLKVGPLWVSWYVEPGTYHIVLVKGYEDTSKGHILYNNPFPGPDNALDARMPANTFVKHITSAMGSIQGVR